ncbi:hypothetical protein ACQY0O_007909 [Thecaphora frezii]
MASHHPGEGWSERNPVPTVQQYREIEAQRQRTAAHNDSRLAQTDADETVPVNSASANDVAPTAATNAEVSEASAVPQAAPSIGNEYEGPRHRKSLSSAGPGTFAGPPPPPSAPVKGAAGDGAGPPTVAKASKDDEIPNVGGGLEEKERIKKQQQPRGKPNQFEQKGERVVTDPTTGGEVQIRDASENAKIDPDRLDSRYHSTSPGFSTNLPKDASTHHPMHTAPYPAQPSNILLQAFPAPTDSDALDRLRSTFQQLAKGLGVAMGVTWFFVAFGAGWLRFVWRTALLIGIGAGGWSGLNVALRKIEREFEHVRAEMHRQRGQQFSPPMPESVEWLNAAIACIWKQINPEMFVSVADMVEDIMQQSLPGFVDAVKIDDLGIGENPFRLVAMRGLADTMGDAEYPREEWIDQGRKDLANANANGDKKLSPEEDADGDGIADDDESGDFLNYEVAFSYSARPGQSSKERAKNIHLLLEFFVGAYDLFQIPLPIWIQVEHISGTLRLRCQVVQQAPYIRNVTFSLMGVPRVEISAIPMSKALPNVLDLPLISGFVQSSIAAAANMYVAPKSMTLNVGQILSGEVKKDVDAVGVLVVEIEYAEDLSSQDANGFSDPYVALAYSKFGRTLYASRIVFEDLNPVWKETAFLLVTKDDLKVESLSVQLWDSDARTADDIVGRVNVPLNQLAAQANQMHDRTDKLMGFEDADSMPGTLKWKVGFFEKADFDPSLIKDEKERQRLVKVTKDREAKDKHGTATASAAPNEGSAEVSALNCPPDPQYPTGILSIIVHHIAGLETRDVEKGVMGKAREGPHGQDVDAKGANGKSLPCGYVEFIVNDDIIYKTRVKQYTNMPFYEAGTETFVRDWTRTEVRLAVRDARLREHDPLMGVVSLDLPSLFEESSQVSQSFAIQDGVGYGKVFATLCFRSVRAKLPQQLLGWDTATVELLSAITIEGDAKLKSKKIKVSTGDATERIAPSQEVPEGKETLVRLPVYDRYSTLLTFDVGGGGVSLGPFGGKPEAVAVCALSDLADDDVVELELDLMAGERLGTLKRNYPNEQTRKTHAYEVVGKLHVKVRIDAGLDDDHLRLVESSAGRKDRHEFEIYNRLEGMPKRAEENAHANDDGVVDSAERKRINKAKTEALHARHRGVMGYTAARTGVWAKGECASGSRRDRSWESPGRGVRASRVWRTLSFPFRLEASDGKKQLTSSLPLSLSPSLALSCHFPITLSTLVSTVPLPTFLGTYTLYAATTLRPALHPCILAPP